MMKLFINGLIEMNEFEYTHELEHQFVLNSYYISDLIFENFVYDEIKKDHNTEKYKIYLLETLASHRHEILKFKSRNTIY